MYYVSENVLFWSCYPSALIAELDEEKDAAMDLSTIRAPALKPVSH